MVVECFVTFKKEQKHVKNNYLLTRTIPGSKWFPERYKYGRQALDSLPLEK
jgi:hypothetical protein